ncbi:MAG: ParB N-terminal domain-containing protein [Leptospiraceae bacterium]|nr:ParB N-terminal domain-containing protein [Leptospiraceae bacterium]
MKDKDSILNKYKHSGLKYFDPEKLQIKKDNPFYRFGFTGEDMDTLRESITKNGVLHPIFIDKNGIVLSGNRRLVICQELGKLIPGYQFSQDLDNEDERIIIYHPNNASRALSGGDKKKLIMERFKDIIGAPKSLPMISRLTGINLSTVKSISAATKKKREFDSLGKKLTEDDYKANLKYFQKLEKIKADMNTLMKQKHEVVKKIEETAPMESWKVWIKEWEKEKKNSAY